MTLEHTKFTGESTWNLPNFFLPILAAFIFQRTFCLEFTFGAFLNLPFSIPPFAKGVIGIFKINLKKLG